jgi:cell division protein FtsX
VGDRDVVRAARRWVRRYFDADPVELALRAALVYVVIGFGYTALHVEVLDQLENALSAQFTTFDDYAALAVTVLMWPLLVVSALACGAVGCGVF